MQITLLGTGPPTPSLRRMNSGYLLRIGEDVILLDHGPASWTEAEPASCGQRDGLFWYSSPCTTLRTSGSREENRTP